MHIHLNCLIFSSIFNIYFSICSHSFTIRSLYVCTEWKSSAIALHTCTWYFLKIKYTHTSSQKDKIISRLNNRSKLRLVCATLPGILLPKMLFFLSHFYCAYFQYPNFILFCHCAVQLYIIIAKASFIHLHCSSINVHCCLRAGSFRKRNKLKESLQMLQQPAAT